MKKRCPLLNKDCMENKCMWWTELTTKKENMVERADNCAVSVLPIMLSEINRGIIGNHAAIESFRNRSGVLQEKFNTMFEQALINTEKRQIRG